MKSPQEHMANLNAFAKRNAKMVSERNAGATFAALAAKYGITRARCEQICKRYR